MLCATRVLLVDTIEPANSSKERGTKSIFILVSSQTFLGIKTLALYLVLKMAMLDEALPLLAKTLKVPLYQLQMIVEEYYPGFSNKVHEIVSRSIEPCPEDKISAVIVLSAIENKSRIM